jgi:hypothetical protein
MRILLVICFAVILGLGFYVFDLRSELETVRASVQAAQEGERKSAAEVEPLRRNVERLTAERDEHRATAKELAANPNSTSGGKKDKPDLAGFLGGVGQLFDSPETKTMMRRESAKEVRKKFADLLKKWNLSKTDSDLFLEMVTDIELSSADAIFGLLGKGESTPEKMAESMKESAAAQDESRARLKGLLGEARYEEWEKSNEAATTAMATDSYRDHLAEAGVVLSETQHADLAKLVKAERAASGMKDGPEKEAEDMAMISKGLTDAQIAKMRQESEAYQARVAQKAAGFLSPDQVNALQDAFKQENEATDFGLKMIRKFLPADGKKDPAPVGAPETPKVAPPAK